jgi:hypothetical protein
MRKETTANIYYVIRAQQEDMSRKQKKKNTENCRPVPVSKKRTQIPVIQCE